MAENDPAGENSGDSVLRPDESAAEQDTSAGPDQEQQQVSEAVTKSEDASPAKKATKRTAKKTARKSAKKTASAKTDTAGGGDTAQATLVAADEHDTESGGTNGTAAPADTGQQAGGRATRPAGPPEPAAPLAAVFLPPRAEAAEPAGSRSTSGRTDEKDDKPAESTADPDTADSDSDTDTDTDTDSDADEGDDRPRRRRRRGGRGRRRRSSQQEQDGSTEDADEPATEDGTDGEAAEPTSEQDTSEQDDSGGDSGEQRSSRRRRRRRRRGSGGGGESSSNDPPNTVVKVREPRETDTDEVTGVKGSTRLEAKRQRRREGRDNGRKRAPVLSEAEFLARRESVERVMVTRQVESRTQIAVLEDDVLVEHYVERSGGNSYVGNVYLGRVQNVLPSMEAAFIDIGRGRNAVVYAGEVNFAGLEGKPKRIESVLKSGQSVIVQVTKGPVGQKGARLTTQIGLPGRYLVYSPDSGTAGISRKLPDKERARLKQVLRQAVPENGGVIVRTAAEGASEDELRRDVNRLVAQWEAIQAKAKTASAPALLYEEPDLTVRVIRDVFNEDFSKLVVSGDDAWDMVEPYIQHVAPHLADRTERWVPAPDGDKAGESGGGNGDVFAAYRIDEQLAKALERKVWLPSGGSLIIDRTEAMTVIDVNTGKFTGQGGDLEETVTRNNLEAAEEIVRQLRLRDIGGI
ncbi:MAG: Rne/Rng family ribonuclease, partial [Streptosporangiales bacterium]